MALRGTSSRVSSGSSINITLPLGTLVGDLAILFAVHGYDLTMPSGWTPQVANNGLTLNGFAATKVLNSTDISAGSVTISAAGTFSGLAAMATFVGAGTGIREVTSNHSAGAIFSDTLTTSGSVLTSDGGVYFGATRTGSPTISVAPGTTAQTPGDPNMAGVLGYQLPMPSGSSSVTFTFNGAANGFWDAMVIAKGLAVGPSQRGNIDYDQVRTTARAGNGPLFQMAATGTVVGGHMAVYDASGNIVDGGAAPSAITLKTNGTNNSSQTLLNLAAGSNITLAESGGTVTITSSGGGGGGGVTAPTIRGTAIQASSAGSYTVSWPSATVAGDLAVIFGGHGWNLIAPTGWTSLDNSTGTNWNGAVFYRVLNGADITTGSVTVTAGGSFDGVLAIASFVGGSGGIRTKSAQQNGSGSSSVTLPTDGSPLTTDMMLYFGSNRAASTDTVSLGSNLRQANNGSAASGCLFAGSPAAAGGVSPVFSYSSAGSGNYQVAVAVKGS